MKHVAATIRSLQCHSVQKEEELSRKREAWIEMYASLCRANGSDLDLDQLPKIHELSNWEWQRVHGPLTVPANRSFSQPFVDKGARKRVRAV